MRIGEAIVANGDFWLPTDPDAKSGGTMTIDVNGSISLEFFDFPLVDFLIPERFDDSSHIKDEALIPLTNIFGDVYPYGSITLIRCRDITPKYYLPRPTPIKFLVDQVLLGAHCENIETLMINELIYSVDSLHTWLQVDGLNIEINKDYNSFEAKLDIPESIFVTSHDEIKIQFTFMPNKPGSGITFYSEPKITLEQHAFVSLTPSGNATLYELLDLATRFRDFISLGFGRHLPITTVAAYSSEFTHSLGDDIEEEVLLQFIFNDGHIGEGINSDFFMEMPFDYPHVSNSLHSMVDIWLKNYNTLEESFNLYHAVIGNEQLIDNIRFLWLTQSLESLHRDFYNETSMPEQKFMKRQDYIIEVFEDTPDIQKWLVNKLKYANEPTMRNRFLKLSNVALPANMFKEKLRSLVNDIVDARNFLTHRDQEITNGVELVNSGRISDLSDYLIAIFQLWNLRQIGFNDIMIEDIVCRNPRMALVFGVDVNRDYY